MDAGRVLPLSLASQGLLTDYPGGSLPQLQTGLLLKSCPRFAVEMCKVSSLPCLRMGEQSSRQNAPLKSIANAADAMFSSLPARHGTHAWDPKPCKGFKYCSEIEEVFFLLIFRLKVVSCQRDMMILWGPAFLCTVPAYNPVSHIYLQLILFGIRIDARFKLGIFLSCLVPYSWCPSPTSRWDAQDQYMILTVAASPFAFSLYIFHLVLLHPLVIIHIFWWSTMHHAGLMYNNLDLVCSTLFVSRLASSRWDPHVVSQRRRRPRGRQTERRSGIHRVEQLRVLR